MTTRTAVIEDGSGNYRHTAYISCTDLITNMCLPWSLDGQSLGWLTQGGGQWSTTVSRVECSRTHARTHGAGTTLTPAAARHYSETRANDTRARTAPIQDLAKDPKKEPNKNPLLFPPLAPLPSTTIPSLVVESVGPRWSLVSRRWSRRRVRQHRQG